MQIGPGDRFGRYEIRSSLGAGGMGEVFRAYDPRLAREVALKVLAAHLDRRPEAHARFEQEARSASALNHPNIVAIYDIGEEDGRPFIVMELLEGQNLRALLSDPIPTELLVRLALQITDALTAAHARGIVHRDLKPENIFVTMHGTVKVLDFGLARISDPVALGETVERLTAAGGFLGTPGYASPEALSGRDVDARADLFSLGAILYEMACGAPAFAGESTIEAFAATLRDEPPPVSERRPDLSSHITRVITRCLEKVPQRRYLSASEIAEELRGEVAAAPEPPSKPRRRRRPPAPLTALIGRDEELARVEALIAHERVRLTTLTGPGGVGKTRLALAVAERLLPHFRNEVVFVPLGTIRDSALVGSAIAEAMGATVRAGESALTAAVAELNSAGARTLIILDNFEQVMSAASELSELLGASPLVSLLVTSREILHLYGEHDIPVQPLPLPAQTSELSVEELAQNAAVALFLARARAADPAFRLNHDTAEAVAEICRRLDGLPLALELAAARVRTLSASALLTRLRQRLQILTSGPRDLPDRQHTMRRAIDWSYGLLTPDEQTLFRRLSVFVSGFSMEAAEAVCDPYQKLSIAVVDGIASLVDKSLLQKQDAEDGARFGMLETIDEYATDLLASSADSEPTHRAHAAYYLVLAEEGAGALATAESSEWLAQFAAEHDNLRAALDWLLRVEDAEWGLRLAFATFHFWERTEHLTEGRRWLGAFLDLPGASRHPKLRARAQFSYGVLASAQGDQSVAVEHTLTSLGLYRDQSDPWGMAVAHNSLGIILTELGELDRAGQHLADSLGAWREAGDEKGYARSLSNLAFVRRRQRQYDEARRLYDEAAAIFARTGDRLSSAWALSHQGGVARDQRQWDDARRLYDEALEAFRTQGDAWGTASTLADLGTLARSQGDAGRASSRYHDALCSFVRLGHRRGVARVLESMAVLAGQGGTPERALILSSAAAALRATLGVTAPMTDQDELARSLDAARQAVGTTAADAAQQRGAVMSLAEVVRYVETTPDQAG